MTCRPCLWGQTKPPWVRFFSAIGVSALPVRCSWGLGVAGMDTQGLRVAGAQRAEKGTVMPVIWREETTAQGQPSHTRHPRAASATRSPRAHTPPHRVHTRAHLGQATFRPAPQGPTMRMGKRRV